MSYQSGNGVIGDVARFVKDHKLISRGLSLFPNPAMQLASRGAAMVGLGKRKRRRRVVGAPRAIRIVRPRAVRPRMVGNGIFSDLGGGIGSIFGGLGGGIGSVAHGLFGGRKRKRAPKKKLVR